jgi:hypothetical protein
MTQRTMLLLVGTIILGSSLLAQHGNAQATYTLKPTPKTVAWGYYDAKVAGILCTFTSSCPRTAKLRKFKSR